MKRSISIRITGIVQGVGFRPFIHNLARRHGLFGYVLNDTEGVFIEAEGDDDDIRVFIEAVRAEAPPLSYIHAVTSREQEPKDFSSFVIEKSRPAEGKEAFYSPDVAVCPECLAEYFDPSDRRHHYPFITCINCGPRFSIIRDVPYDRANTTMDVFPMCERCAAEYGDSRDRRFHTQPNACPVCGPRYRICDSRGEDCREADDFAGELVRLIKNGGIVALKGVGGYLLALDAKNDAAVGTLRDRKKRPFKPFALMAGSMEAIRRYAAVSPVEENLLLEKERPIVLLKTVAGGGGNGRGISPLVAPKVTSLGFMLPYTPLQHHLFRIDPDMVLVMTSGNLSEEPMVYRDGEAFGRLGNIADYIAPYNREILGQSDDSVLFVVRSRPFFVRRARGYVPLPFHSSHTDSTILAMGGDLKNSFALARKDFIIMSQHLGDMGDPVTFAAFKKTVEHFMTIFDADPDTIAADLHPGYVTTQYADELAALAGTEPLKVQHHHAHIASVLEDNGVDERVLGLAFDGTGYGPDGTLWGSEFLVADRAGYERAGHFSYFPLPGGENAIRDVWKIGLSLLITCGADIRGWWGNRNPEPVAEIIRRGINAPLTCSIGRLFDGVSAILGISESISTEAEAAILLEEAASGGALPGDNYLVPWKEKEGVLEIDSGELVRYIIQMKKNGCSHRDIAAAFHHAVVNTAVRVLEELRSRTGINTIAASGGVFHNKFILENFIEKSAEKGFNLLLPRKVPINDGCIALGQAAVVKGVKQLGENTQKL